MIALAPMDGPGAAPRTAKPEYRALVQKLYNLSRGGTKLGLNRTAYLLEKLGNPERNYLSAHVTGSNGKGSTSAFLASILAEHGLKVGLFTSPHLIRLTERFRFLQKGQHQEIEQDELLKVAQLVEARLPGFAEASFFETITALGFFAFDYFEQDAAVIEAGLGARLDSTRLLPASVGILTELTLEHTGILGDSLAEVAQEEACVIRPHKPLVMADGPQEAMQVVDRMAKAAKAPIYRLGREIDGNYLGSNLARLRLTIGELDRVSLSLPGAHQARNAALAAQSALLLYPEIDEDTLRRGLGQAQWPGRMEWFSPEQGSKVMLDGAHNAQAAEALAKSLSELEEKGPFHLVFGALRDKSVREMLAYLAPLAESLTFCAPDTHRALDPVQLQAALPKKATPQAVFSATTPVEAYRIAQEEAAKQGGMVVVCGSLYLVGAVRALLTDSFSD